MIAGIGVDVVECERFAALLSEEGSAFAERTFTAHERAVSKARPSGLPAVHLAARYAAKEACIKAISQALAPSPLPSRLALLSEIEVVSDSDGRPHLALAGRMRQLAEQAAVRAIHVSLSHDGPVAVAYVVAER